MTEQELTQHMKECVDSSGAYKFEEAPRVLKLIAEIRRLQKERDDALPIFQVPNTNNYWTENAGPVWNEEIAKWEYSTHTAKLIDIKKIGEGNEARE